MAGPLIHPSCPAHVDQQLGIMLRACGSSAALCHASVCYKHNGENAAQLRTADSGTVRGIKCKDGLFHFGETPMLCLQEKCLGWDVLCHSSQQPDQTCLEARGAILNPQSFPTRTLLPQNITGCWGTQHHLWSSALSC